MENPLAQIVNRAQGVEQVKSDFSKDSVTVHLKLSQDASLREIYRQITTDGASIIGSRKVKLELESDSSPEIEKWWSNALFDVAQAMETKHYADIPKILESKSADVSGLKAATEMDDKNVYIRLSEGGKNKYIILPRVPASMGVWPNA
ncbi:hypothetical protein N6H14_30305 [Paenibacillus sp. CC-CFT747]|nr:hypothetical protein N6H14_30305 [Paenibacillus sp. CC-CFT747]